jgi:hypothetical protein
LSPCYDDFLDNQSSSVVSCFLSIGSDILAIPFVSNNVNGYTTLCDINSLWGDLTNDFGSLDNVRAGLILVLDVARFSEESIRTTCTITGSSCLLAIETGGTFALADAGCVASAACYTYTTAIIVLLDAALCAENWLYNVTCNQNYDQCANDFIIWTTDYLNQSISQVSNYYSEISN